MDTTTARNRLDQEAAELRRRAVLGGVALGNENVRDALVRLRGVEDRLRRELMLDAVPDGIERRGVERLLEEVRDATEEVERLRNAGRRPRSDLAMTAIASRADASRAVLSLAGHMVARRCDPAVVLGLLECYDQVRNTPPLGAKQVGDLLRWVARRELSKGAA